MAPNRGRQAGRDPRGGPTGRVTWVVIVENEKKQPLGPESIGIYLSPWRADAARGESSASSSVSPEEGAASPPRLIPPGSRIGDGHARERLH